MKKFSKITFYLLLALSLGTSVNCGKKKKKAMFWMAGLTGGGTASAGSGTGSGSSGSTITDSNGVPLTTSSASESVTPAQEVATHGQATISGTLNAKDCKNASNEPIACSADSGLDLTTITIQLVDNNGNVISTTQPDANGNYTFNIPDLNNGDYRVLINSGNGLNYAYQDVNFVFNPVDANANIKSGIDLSSSRLYLTSGPATITGTATTPGFKDQNGNEVVAAGPLPNGTVVQLKDKDGNVIATTTTTNGNYTFTIDSTHPLLDGTTTTLANGNYSITVIGSGQSSNGQPFTDTSSAVPIQFSFQGNNPATPTVVTIPGLSSAWNPASSATATLTNWSIQNVAISGSDLSGFTVKLKDANGNVVGTTTTNATGQYSFSQTLSSGIYSIEITKDGFLTSSSSFSFTPNPSGSATSVTQSAGPNNVVPRPSNVTGQVAGVNNQPPRIEGASMSFRPDTTQSPSNLLYLATGSDDRLRNLTSLWMREACGAIPACVTACGAGGFQPSCVAANQGTGPWTYTTYANKVYETNGNNVFFTAVAGKWNYFISAPGYNNSASNTITLNGQDVVADPIILTPSTHRAQIAGQSVIFDTLVNGTRNVYGAPATGFTTQPGIPGLFAIMLGNSDNSGNPVAHITTTTATGSYAFDGNSKVVTLPSSSILCANSTLVGSVYPGQTSLSGSACNDAADTLRVAYTISQFSAAPLLSAASNVVANDVNSSVCSGAACPGTGGYQFRGGSYNIIVTDPLKHMTASSTGAAVNAGTVGLGGTLTVISQVPHLPRRQITGTITDAISTGPMNGATIELGIDTDSNPNTITFGNVRRDPDTISGSRLGATDIQVPSVTTNANGQYTINNVDPGNYVIRVTRPGYVTELIQVTVPSTGSPTVANVQIVLDGPRGNLSGRIVIAGGAPFTGTYTLEIVHPTAGTRPTAPVAPGSLASGTSAFTNVPNYSIFSINPGTWKVKFASAGYVAVEGTIVIQPSATTNFDIVTMIPGTQGPASVSGRLINAINNRAITCTEPCTGLTVRIRPGIGATSGPYALDANNQTIGAITAASDGSYVIPNVPAGNYTVEVSGDGFVTTYQTVISAGANSSNQNILVSPSLGADEVRIVLSWLATPRDVDSHLEYGNAACLDGGNKCQVVWNQKSKLGGDLTLDVDVVTGFGPETTTMKGSVWTSPTVTRLGYSLFNWSNDASLSVSGSTVKVYKASGLVRTYNSGPGQVSRWWQIFCFDKATKNITDVGQGSCSASDFFNASKN